jgi:DNA polymerase-3 subunit alpha
MRDILRKAKPQRLDDLIALNALYRPGPLRSGMVDDYIARKQGRTEVKYELAELEPVLADTYGVIAYQEQVMRISNVVAGFSLGEADILRKAMGKKNAEVMQKQRAKFVDGAKKRGVNERKAAHSFRLDGAFRRLWLQQVAFDPYAYLAYQTAISVKANYPWHFAAALFTIEAQNAETGDALGESARRDVPVLPPDINQSQLRFIVEPGKGVRFGLTAIKNVGDGAIESLLQVRATGAGSNRSAHCARTSTFDWSTSACSRV